MEKYFLIDTDEMVEVEIEDEIVKFDIKFNDKMLMEVFGGFSTLEADVDLYIEYSNALKRDLIMCLLNDAHENILKAKLNKASNQKKYVDLYNELYFSDKKDFVDLLNKIENTELPDHVKDVIITNTSDLYYLIPKTVFNWYIYALEKVIFDRVSNGSKINKIIDTKRLPLFNLKNSGYEISEESREDLLKFLKQLSKELDDQNSSLNLLYFNNETSLFSLYYFLIEYAQSIHAYKKNNLANVDEKKLSKELELLFNDYVKFANYEGIATQIYFIENRRYVKPRANDTHFIVEYNRFVDKLKNSVRSKLIEEFEIKNELKLPDSIESDVLVYKFLRREELYKEFIIDFKEDELNEIPQLVYKSCYEALYNEKNI